MLSATNNGLEFSISEATIDTVYFAQTHVSKPSDPYFVLVSNRDTLIKAHVVAPGSPIAPEVTATLTLGSQTLDLPLTGPATLPASIPDGPGVVQHSFDDSFTAIIPAAWMHPDLDITVTAGTASVSYNNLDIGAPTVVEMTMFDVEYFNDVTGDYPAGTLEEVEAKWPVADLVLTRVPDVVFRELVIPARGGAPAVRVSSPAEYLEKTGLNFDGEQAAALAWNGALKRAAGRSGRIHLSYVNIYGVPAGGQAGGFAGVGSGTSQGILHHELGHALSLPHWGDAGRYPYKGDMHGIPAPDIYNGTHAGPTWAFDLPTQTFIPPTTQPGNVRNHPVGTYKADPMQGGGTGFQEPEFLLNHFSDYSVWDMQDYLEGHVLVWNDSLNSYASWNQSNADYTNTVSNNGVRYPVVRDVDVITVMASILGSDPDVNMVYPPIGAYEGNMIDLFDPRNAGDRSEARQDYGYSQDFDVSLRIIQGGVEKIYMLPASYDSTLRTEAVNLPAADGEVTSVELLYTPNAEWVGLPADAQVLYTWSVPTVTDPIDDVIVDEDADDTVIDLAARFDDYKGSVLALTVSGNTNEALVTATISEETLTLDYVPNANGTAEITVRATDSVGEFVEDTFTVTVTPVGDPPVLVHPLGQLRADAHWPDMTIDLMQVFNDPDGIGLDFTIESHPAPGLVAAAVAGDELTLSFPAYLPGTAQITIRATDDDELFVEDTLTVLIGPYVDARDLVARFAFDTADAADTAPYGVEDDSGTLVGGAVIVDDPDRGWVVSLDGDDDRVAIPAGSADIEDTAVSNRTISLWFKADSLSGNQVLYEEGPGDGEGLILFLFNDTLYVFIQGSGTVLLSTAVPDDGQWHHVALVLDGLADMAYGYFDGEEFGAAAGVSLAPHSDGVGIGNINGTALLFYTVGFDGLIDDVRVYNRVLNAHELASLAGRPYVVTPIDDVAVDWLADDAVVDLSGVFSNPGVAPLVLSVTQNTDPAAVGTSLVGTDLTLDYTAFVSGQATITIRATADNGYYAEDTFVVTVSAIADPTPPTVVLSPAGSILQPTDSLLVSFSDAIYAPDAADAGNYLLVAAGPDGALGTGDDIEIALTPSANGDQVTLTAGAELSPGAYRLTIYDGLRNHAGLALDGDGDASPGGDWSGGFEVVILGDVDKDGDVDNADIGKAAGSFTGAGGSTAMTWADGDMDGDGDVDNADLGLIGGAYTGATAGGGTEAQVAEAPAYAAQQAGALAAAEIPADTRQMRQKERMVPVGPAQLSRRARVRGAATLGPIRPVVPTGPLGPASPAAAPAPAPAAAKLNPLAPPDVLDVLAAARAGTADLRPL